MVQQVCCQRPGLLPEVVDALACLLADQYSSNWNSGSCKCWGPSNYNVRFYAASA